VVESALAESVAEMVDPCAGPDPRPGLAKLGAVGLVLHPRRDNAEAVEAVAAW
jgi:hypothetical protein